MMVRCPFGLAVVFLFCAGASLIAPSEAAEPAATASHFPGLAAMNLTAQQQQRLSDMENGSRGQTKQLIEQIRRLRDKLGDLFGNYSLDVGEAQRLNQQLNRVQGQLLDLRLSEQQQLRGILSQEQFAQLQSALRQQGGWNDHSHDHHAYDHGPQGHPGPDVPGHGSAH